MGGGLKHAIDTSFARAAHLPYLLRSRRTIPPAELAEWCGRAAGVKIKMGGGGWGVQIGTRLPPPPIMVSPPSGGVHHSAKRASGERKLRTIQASGGVLICWEVPPAHCVRWRNGAGCIMPKA